MSLLFLFRLVAVVVFGVFAVTGFLFVLRYYEGAAKDAVLGVRRPIDRARIAAGLGAWARESGANLLHAIVWPLGLFPRPRIRHGAWLPVEREVRHGNPVLLAPGYAMNRACFRLMRPRLEASKRPALPIDFPWGKSIEELADVLGAGAAELKAATGSAKIDLVCHSRGGLVALWWIHKMGGADHVERVVLLGTPVSGTKAGAFALGPTAFQMLPGCELLRSLAAIPLDPRVTFYAVNGDAEAIVIPPGNDELPAPGRNIRLEGVGHMGLLFSATAWHQVHAALRRTLEDEAPVRGFEDETQDQAASRAIAQFGR